MRCMYVCYLEFHQAMHVPRQDKNNADDVFFGATVGRYLVLRQAETTTRICHRTYHSQQRSCVCNKHEAVRVSQCVAAHSSASRRVVV